MALIMDRDRDSLHVLPLSIIPLESQLFEKMRMIKNVHLDSVVELFDGKDTGSGQIRVEAMRAAYESIPQTDMAKLDKLSRLRSYDVYSLRILLRKQGINVDEGELRLSDGKQRELTQHMRSFTRPLVGYIYGDERAAEEGADIISMFSQPDIKQARKKLVALAGSLEIPLELVPKFLEDYGDIFLSISYYRQAYGGIGPVMRDFRSSVEEIKSNRLLQQDRNVVDACSRVESVFSDMAMSMRQKIKVFEFGSKNMWVDINGAKFRKFRDLVENSQTMLGGSLCAMSLKMDAWKETFPDPQFGGPMKRAEFIVNDMQQGLEKFQKPRVRSIGPRVRGPKAPDADQDSTRVWSGGA
ncbi:MAG: hypothetical protein HN403_18790 [Rhodospirillales bacterium]|jgi:hypothetical protein|nr:hypothetical protein [Rhodospirillales bacterium]